MILFIAEKDEIDSIGSEYELINRFIDKWIEREEDKHLLNQAQTQRLRRERFKARVRSIFKKTNQDNSSNIKGIQGYKNSSNVFNNSLSSFSK